MPGGRVIFISCAGTKLPGIFEGVLKVAKYFFKMLEIEMLAAQCYNGTDPKGAIMENKIALGKASDYGRQLCRSQ